MVGRQLLDILKTWIPTTWSSAHPELFLGDLRMGDFKYLAGILPIELIKDAVDRVAVEKNIKDAVP